MAFTQHQQPLDHGTDAYATPAPTVYLLSDSSEAGSMIDENDCEAMEDVHDGDDRASEGLGDIIVTKSFNSSVEKPHSTYTVPLIVPAAPLQRTFPQPLRTNSLLNGPDTSSVLRVCFRLADIVSALKKQQKSTEMIFEIYGRVTMDDQKPPLPLAQPRSGERKLQRVNLRIKDLYHPESQLSFAAFMFADIRNHPILSTLTDHLHPQSSTDNIVRIIAIPHIDERTASQGPYASTKLEIRKLEVVTMKEVKWTQGIVVGSS